MDINHSFYQLTPDSILNAIESLGYEPTGRFYPLNSVENRVYDIETSNFGRIVVKFYRPGKWSYSEVLEEHQFLSELSSEEIPVLTPITIQGKTLFEWSGIYFAIWPLRNGRIVEEIAGGDLERVGALLGRIHSIGKRTNSKNRPVLDIPSYGLKSLNFILDKKLIPNNNLAERYKSTALRSFEIFESLVKEYQIPFQRIHGDCHKGNLLISQEGFSILDFDDFQTGPIVQDFWMLLPLGEKDRQNDLFQFLQGYTMFADFDENWLQLVEPLRIVRYVHYAAWIAKRWEDPSFPSLFPHFGSEEYWLKETLDLESAKRDLEEQSFEGMSNPNDSEPEMTNKDFFWDWEN
ncbi:serine/threonine protein kinase [Leptospira congkakensis]|uniref:Stress response kinase A n=1 Tax=Leptospira congkakensis TaxID=2484932 RepID=A0A4Z1A7Q6_9LEPT|nr:serine/threonine protein kinase [Leptospira congkakensis]TGL85274.1 serine/threonine protein kinase [Leptospira congkakensis]TGL85375.1 serine/threonine protein kinase [Leptospira congkakensis]TGL99881.1 serine/threonine protein kinase [Leptospira congkakensis]